MTKHPRLVDDSDRQGAKAAIARATASLQVAEARAGLVDTLSSRLKIEGSTNHFIQRLNMHKKEGGSQ